MSKQTIVSILSVISLTVVVLIAWSCEGGGPPIPNTKPITRLANVPPPDSFIVSDNPRLTLSWIGDDPDGYVIAFRYRWSYRLNAASPFEYKPWTTVLSLWNIVGGGTEGKDNFALMTDADVGNLPNVYHYFAILLNGLNDDSASVLVRGESLNIAGAHVWASNPRANRFPVHTKPTSGTFIFDSQDSLNPHTFEVLSVDNNAAEGDPARVSFGTPRVIPPRAEVIGYPDDTVMVIDQQSETFSGIKFEFRGFDPNSRTIDYSWVVDRDQWPKESIPWSPFSQNTVVYITANDFPDPYATNHTIYVRARNEFGSIDTVGFFLRQRFDSNNTPLLDSLGHPIRDTVKAQKNFITIYPPFRRPAYQQRILLLNISYSYFDDTPSHPSQSRIDQYYLSLLGSIGKSSNVDVLNVIDNNNTGEHFFPGRGILSNYSTVILVGDAIDLRPNLSDYSWHHNYQWTTREKILLDYCYIGGKMIISAWNLPWILNAGIGALTTNICHIQNVDNPRQIDTDTLHTTFIGARGEKGYPAYIRVDSTKLEPDWRGSLHYLIPGRPFGFGEILYRYDTAKDDQFEDRTIGVRYLGVTFDAIYFGFPLYYMEQQGSTDALRQALSDINELNR